MIINHTLNKIINKSEALTETLLDLTQDTVEEGVLGKERTAHDREGEQITGTFLVEDAEAWARGTRKGFPVPETDETYHNNSKWYSEVSYAEAVVSGSAMLMAGEYAETAEQASVIAGSAMLIAGNSAVSAENSAIVAGSSMRVAGNHAKDAEAWAVGERGGDPVSIEDETYHNNSKYWSERAQEAATGIVPRGTCLFADLPSLASSHTGDMWNIEDDFITTSDFREGAGIPVDAGSNVYKTVDNKWDVMATNAVTGIKGNAEQNYRKGNVNLTPANLGLYPFSASTLSIGGMVPPSQPEDEDKVFQGNGTWGHKLQIDIVKHNGVYGYIDSGGNFVSFKSQADIDAAVAAAMVGTATAADVLSGKTFTNSSTSGVHGSMPNLSTDTIYQHSSSNTTPHLPGDAVYFSKRYNKSTQTDDQNVIGVRYSDGAGYLKNNTLVSYPATAFGNAGTGNVLSGKTFTSSAGLNLKGTFAGQEKTVTAGTSAASVTPDSGKYLSKVTYNPTPSQEKTVTAGTSAASVTPDSGKLLSKVTYNPTPSQTKTATPATTSQSITPDSGKLLSKVTVNAISPLRTTDSIIVPRWGTGAGGNVPATKVATENPRVDFGNNTTYGSDEMVEIAMPQGFYAWSYGNSGICIPTETKSVTAGTANKTVSPTEYNTSGKYVKFLKSVTVKPTPSQTKSTTSSRTAQTITPDDGKLLSSVSIAKYPDASGTYTPTANSSASDMGATNNYRYVDTRTVYNLGSSAGLASGYTIVASVAPTASNVNPSLFSVANGHYYLAAGFNYKPLTVTSGGTKIASATINTYFYFMVVKTTSTTLKITHHGLINSSVASGWVLIRLY